MTNEKTLSLPGVYRLKNDVTGKFYIGSTINSCKSRIGQHFSLLRAGKHSSIKLQNSYNKHGESAFSGDILETFICSKEECRKYSYKQEQIWIDRFDSVNSGYNICEKAEKPNPRTFSKKERIKESARMAPGGYTVTTPSGESIQVNNLSEYARQHNLTASTLTACARGEVSNHKGYYVKRTLPEHQVEYVSAYDKRPDKYVLFDPNGKRYQTNNLTQFCKDHNLEANRTALVQCCKGQNYHSGGWQCHYIENAPEVYIPTSHMANRKKI